MKKLNITAKLAVLSTVALTLSAAGSAKADFITDLTAPNSAISGYTGPYGQVDVNLTDPTHATVTFTAFKDPTSTYQYLIGSGQAAEVNVNATSFTIGSLSGQKTGTGFNGPSLSSSVGNQNVDGMGGFNAVITEFDGFGYSLGQVSFILTDSSGSWTSASDVLTQNADGNVAGAHIFVTANPANQANGALATGFASNGSDTDVPDAGSTLVMLGIAGLGLFAFVRKTKAA